MTAMIKTIILWEELYSWFQFYQKRILESNCILLLTGIDFMYFMFFCDWYGKKVDHDSNNWKSYDNNSIHGLDLIKNTLDSNNILALTVLDYMYWLALCYWCDKNKYLQQWTKQIIIRE